MKTIVVASTNPVKIQAALNGFTRMFPEEAFEARGVSVSSEVSHQPMSDEETRRGARNRARNAQSALREADYWIGVEGGCEAIDNELTAFAWIYILDRAGRASESRSATFVLPPAVANLVHAGVELGEADDRIFGRQNSKQMNGAVGLLTHDVVDRIALYDMPVTLALIPFRNPLLYE